MSTPRDGIDAPRHSAALATVVGPWQRLWERAHQLPTPLLLAAVGGLVLVLSVGLALLPVLLGVDQSDLEALGYIGVFLANFLGTASLFVPVPGLTAAGQVLIVTLADRSNPALVAIVGGLGMATAETTAYLAGRGLRTVSSRRPMPIGGRVGRILAWLARLVDRMMLRYGVPTLFVLSAIPNPVFEFAGVTAGAVRMPFLRFLMPVLLGKLLRAFLLAFLGQHLLDLII